MKHLFKAALCLMICLAFFSCASKGSGISEEQSLLFSTQGVDSVSVKVYRSEVEVRLWDKKDILVIAESQNGEFPVCYVNGTTLLCKIESGKESSKSKLRIFVPESFYAEDWRISTVSGNIDVSQLWCDDCGLESTSGKIKLDRCEVNDLEVSSTSGKIQADNLICSDESEFSSTSGAVRVSGVLAQTDISTTSGSIELELSRPFEDDSSMSSLSGAIRLSMPENNGFELEFSSLSGRVTDEFTSFKGKGSGRTTYRNGKVKIEAETLSGAISIKKNN